MSEEIIPVLRSRLVLYWAFLGAVAAALGGGLLLLPSVLSAHRLLPVYVLSIAGGAATGAVVAVLYRGVGRVWFWAIVFMLSTALAISLISSRGGSSVLLPCLGLFAAGALSLWVLAASWLHSLLRKRS